MIDQQFLEVEIESIPKFGDGSGAKGRVGVAKDLETNKRKPPMMVCPQIAICSTTRTKLPARLIQQSQTGVEPVRSMASSRVGMPAFNCTI